MAAKILGSSLGECVHGAGVLNFLRMAEEQSYQVEFTQACLEEGILGKRFVFGGTPPVVEEARKVGLLEALFSGEEPMEAMITYLRGKPLETMGPEDYPAEMVDRIKWNARRQSRICH